MKVDLKIVKPITPLYSIGQRILFGAPGEEKIGKIHSIEVTVGLAQRFESCPVCYHLDAHTAPISEMSVVGALPDLIKPKAPAKRYTGPELAAMQARAAMAREARMKKKERNLETKN